MPTSSQCLILQTTNGHLPPFFGRRFWRAEPPPGPEWTSSEYPMTTVQIRENFAGSENKRGKAGRKPQTFQRTSSAPELTCRVDFSSLPNLLRIRGLHGTVRYDTDDKYISWRINSIGPFYNRLNLRGRHYPMAGKSTVGALKYFHAYRANDSFYNRDEISFAENTNRLELKKQVHFHDQEMNGETGWKNNERLSMKDVFMSVEENVGGKMQMVKTTAENADYFKLVQIKQHPYENEQSNEIPLFRLEKCLSTEPGCFRLAPTESRGVGDFTLVPPQGYLADDFRLVPSPEVQDAFIILQSDTNNPGQYRPVLRNKDAHGEFRLVQAKIKKRTAPDVFVPRQAWEADQDYFEKHDGYEHRACVKDKSIHDASPDYGYNYFDEIRHKYNLSPAENNDLPDISIYEHNRSTVLHPKLTNAKKYGETSMLNKDLKVFNQELDEFNKAYEDTMQYESSNGNARTYLFDLKKPYSDKENQPGTLVGAGPSSTDISGEWRTHNFDQWSRTTKKTLLEPLETVDVGITRSVQKIPSINRGQQDVSQKYDPLLDEVQFKANVKQWKKKKAQTVRLRKILPPSDPNAICIRFEGKDISHDELKTKIEKETCHKVVGLQFDPVSVHSIDPEAVSRWIVRFLESSICEELSQNGITINGVKLRVRKYDDVMKEEHEAYKLYKLVKEFTERKTQKTSVRKDIKTPKVLKTTQTQTK